MLSFYLNKLSSFLFCLEYILQLDFKCQVCWDVLRKILESKYNGFHFFLQYSEGFTGNDSF